MGKPSVTCLEARHARLVVAGVGMRRLGVANAVEVNAVNVVGAREMQQDVGRVGGGVRMPEVEVPVRGELIAAFARLRAPLPRTAARLAPLRVPEVLQEDVTGIARKPILRRIAVKNRADDDECVNLDA